MPAIVQTFSTNATALGDNITWNQAGGTLDFNSCNSTFSVGPSGVTLERPGYYLISASCKFRLSGARNQGNLRLLVNGADIGPAELRGTETYHRSAGTSPNTVELVSEIAGIYALLAAGDVISCALERVDNNTTNGTLTMVLARLTVARSSW